MKSSRAVAVPPQSTALPSPYAAYLQAVVEKTGQSASAIAKKLGMPESTLTRHLPKKDGTLKRGTPRTMHADIVHRLEAYSGVEAPSALGSRRGAAARMSEPRPPAHFITSDVIKFSAANDDIDVRGSLDALIGNRPNTEEWELKSTALECVGFLPGDLLIVDRNAPPRDRDIVCVNYVPWGRAQHAETLMRVYRDIGGMRFAIGATFDPSMQDPIPVDNERAVIMGVVTHSLRIVRR